MSSRYQSPMHAGGSLGRIDRTSLVEYEAIPEETPKARGEYETDKGLTDDRWLISVKDGQFPPAHMEWLRDFERDPDQPLKKSYRSGILLGSVDQNAPVLNIAMTFMAGADKPTVAKAEMSKISDLEPPQKSHEWRMFTAATLLQRFEIGTDLSIQKKDNSHEIMIAYKERKGQIRSPGSSMYNEPIRSLLTKNAPDMDDPMALIKRNPHDHTLTIDSDRVKLMHGLPTDGHFDIACTLIEIDMFSMRDLMTNYRTIVQDGGRNIAAKEVVQILDVSGRGEQYHDSPLPRKCPNSPETIFIMQLLSTLCLGHDQRCTAFVHTKPEIIPNVNEGNDCSIDKYSLWS